MCRIPKSSADLVSKKWTDWANWDRIGYKDWPNRRQPDLKETNHPMFHRSRFLGTDEEFLLISPAVRLASQLLYAPKSMLFIYSLVYECKKLPSDFDYMGTCCFEFRRTAETNERLIQARVDRIFREMGSHSTFGPTTEADERYYQMERRGVAALCTHDSALDQHREDGPVLHDTIKRCGHRAKLLFVRHHTDQIKHLHACNKTHSLDMLNIQFQLARVLCHESIHGIQHARSWESRSQEIKDWKEGKPFREWGLNEPYYEDDPLSELGIAWEREIFGCALSGGFIPWAPRSFFIDGSEWTSGIIDFSQQEVYLSTYPDSPQRGNGNPVHGRFSILPMAYIHQLQQRSFWTVLEEQKGRPGSLFSEIPDLRIPKMIGVPHEHF